MGVSSYDRCVSDPAFRMLRHARTIQTPDPRGAAKREILYLLNRSIYLYETPPQLPLGASLRPGEHTADP